MSRRQRRESLAMDLTPLIDVVFLLLIFFLVTSTFKKDELALLLKLPKTEQGTGSEKKIDQLTIELSSDQVAINGKKSTMEELPGTLQKTEKETLVNLRVDGNVQYTRLVKVLDLLQANKLENISLITDKEK
ncbi:MAG: ExbD/TolR family protein [Bacteriovoracia bacterium]